MRLGEIRREAFVSRSPVEGAVHWWLRHGVCCMHDGQIDYFIMLCVA
jgi:hypothetical protein